MSFKSLLLIFIFILPLFGDFYISGGTKHSLTPIKQTRDVTNKNDIRYYSTETGQKLGVSANLIVGSKQKELLDKAVQKYHLKFLKTLSDDIYLYKTSASAQTLNICNALTHEAGIDFAHPDFLIKKRVRTADPYYKYLWHLKNLEYKGADINVEQAWQYTKGENVLVAVIDEGIDIDHKDLKENIAGFANYNDPNTNYPGTNSGNWHGTACAGLMVATENDTGVVGVAPKSRLIAVRYSDTNASKDIEAFDDLMHQGVAVISNSWGSYTKLDAYEAIFKKLATEGRDGKGILIFFATGNEHLNMDQPGINDESESEYVISIGASTHRDEIASYSNYGSALDFLAPGGVEGGQLVTTDAMGEKGYTDWNYNFNFIGTSAAAPIAAGVGALILSANPDLTRDEVLDILKESAVKIGDVPYNNGRNDYAGYGRIDAGAAVALAVAKRKVATYTIPTKIDNFAHVMFQSVLKFSK